MQHTPFPSSSASSKYPSFTAGGAGGIVSGRTDDLGISDLSAHIATSADETLLLTPLGDVIVCRHDDSYDFNPYVDQDDNSYEAEDVSDVGMGRDQYSRGCSQQSFDVLDELSQYDDWDLTDDDATGVLRVPLGRLALKDDKKGGRGGETLHDNNYHLDSSDRHGMSQWEECCDANACYVEPKGLCGGAEESVIENNSERSGKNLELRSKNYGGSHGHIWGRPLSNFSQNLKCENGNGHVNSADIGWSHVVSRRNRKSSSPNSKDQLQIEANIQNKVDKMLSSKSKLRRHAKKSESNTSGSMLETSISRIKNDQSADTIDFADSGDNDSLFITSPPQSHLDSSSTTPKSDEEDGDYGIFNAKATEIGIGDDLSFPEIGTRKGSPTPIMSFDYTGYEPPTPESSTSFEYDGGINSCDEIIMNENNSNIIHPISALTKGGNDDLKQTSPDIMTRNQKSTTQVFPIRPKWRLKKPHKQEKHHHSESKFGDPRSIIPGIPTFLNHLSQIRVTKLSAHPRGHHVLLISEDGLLFSYGSNDRGQLGLGKQPKKSQAAPISLVKGDGGKSSCVTIPSIITPLLENGGKTIDCAAGIDYSLVVVKTEGARIANRKHRQQYTPKQQTSGNDSNSNRSGRTSPSPSVNHVNEWSAHHQMYGFGSNDHLKLGLLDPASSRNKLTTNNSFSTPRRRRRGGGSFGSGSKGRINNPILCNSPDIASPCSILSSSSADDSSEADSESISTDVFLPRRVALHCKIVSRKPQSDTQFATNIKSNGAPSPPFGIFCVAASIDHSAALVRRPSGSVELYTWGRGDNGALGLPLPASILKESGLKETPTTPLQPVRWVEALCNGKEMKNSDGSAKMKSPEKNNPATQVSPRHMIISPTLAVSLSQLSTSHKNTHPPLPKSPSRGKSGAPPRSPQQGKIGKMRHAQFYKSTVGINHSQNTSSVGDMKCVLLPSEHLVKIALGPSCTHAMTSKGRWLVCGSSSDGLLGLGDDVRGVYVPTEVEIPSCESASGDGNDESREHVTNITVGHRHAVAFTNKGSTYSWGISTHSTAFVSKPELISIFEADRESKANLKQEEYLLKSISGDSSYFSSIKRELTSNATKQLMNTSTNAKENNSGNDKERVAIAHAGLDLSVFVLRSGSVLTCGKRSGRLGQGLCPTNHARTPQPLFGKTRLWQF